MTEELTIYLIIDLRTTSSLEDLKNIMRDSALNLNCQREYFTHETEGINSQIKKNNLIYVVEFENLDNTIFFIELIKTLNRVKIELICDHDKIIYMSKQYKKSINTSNNIDCEKIEKIIDRYKSSNKYNRLYKLL